MGVKVERRVQWEKVGRRLCAGQPCARLGVKWKPGR